MTEPENTPPAGPAAADGGEAEAWARVLSAWGDQAAHRAYLQRFNDLEGMSQAGGRYRAVLAERPADPMALAMRQELLKKATVIGLSSLPRSRPAPSWTMSKRWQRALAAALGGWAIWAAYKLFVALRARF